MDEEVTTVVVMGHRSGMSSLCLRLATGVTAWASPLSTDSTKPEPSDIDVVEGNGLRFYVVPTIQSFSSLPSDAFHLSVCLLFCYAASGPTSRDSFNAIERRLYRPVLEKYLSLDASDPLTQPLSHSSLLSRRRPLGMPPIVLCGLDTQFGSSSISSDHVDSMCQRLRIRSRFHFSMDPFGLASATFGSNLLSHFRHLSVVRLRRKKRYGSHSKLVSLWTKDDSNGKKRTRRKKTSHPRHSQPQALDDSSLSLSLSPLPTSPLPIRTQSDETETETEIEGESSLSSTPSPDFRVAPVLVGPIELFPGVSRHASDDAREFTLLPSQADGDGETEGEVVKVYRRRRRSMIGRLQRIGRSVKKLARMRRRAAGIRFGYSGDQTIVISSSNRDSDSDSESDSDSDSENEKELNSSLTTNPPLPSSSSSSSGSNPYHYGHVFRDPEREPTAEELHARIEARWAAVKAGSGRGRGGRRGGNGNGSNSNGRAISATPSPMMFLRGTKLVAAQKNWERVAALVARRRGRKVMKRAPNRTTTTTTTPTTRGKKKVIRRKRPVIRKKKQQPQQRRKRKVVRKKKKNVTNTNTNTNGISAPSTPRLTKTTNQTSSSSLSTPKTPTIVVDVPEPATAPLKPHPAKRAFKRPPMVSVRTVANFARMKSSRTSSSSLISRAALKQLQRRHGIVKGDDGDGDGAKGEGSESPMPEDSESDSVPPTLTISTPSLLRRTVSPTRTSPENEEDSPSPSPPGLVVTVTNTTDGSSRHAIQFPTLKLPDRRHGSAIPSTGHSSANSSSPMSRTLQPRMLAHGAGRPQTARPLGTNPPGGNGGGMLGSGTLTPRRRRRRGSIFDVFRMFKQSDDKSGSSSPTGSSGNLSPGSFLAASGIGGGGSGDRNLPHLPCMEPPIDKGYVCHHYAYTGNLALLKRFVRDAGDVNMRDQYERTPIHYAVLRNNVDCVKFLVKRRNVKINSPDLTGYMPLAMAAQLGHSECVRLLLQVGHADRTIRTTKGRRTLPRDLCQDDEETTAVFQAQEDLEKDFIQMVREGRMSSVAMNCGLMDVSDVKDENGKTPLGIAISKPNNQRMIGTILEAGAYIEGEHTSSLPEGSPYLPMLDKAKRRFKREQVMLELLQTETAYGLDLDLAVRLFCDPFSQPGRLEEIVEREDFRPLITELALCLRKVNYMHKKSGGVTMLIQQAVLGKRGVSTWTKPSKLVRAFDLIDLHTYLEYDQALSDLLDRLKYRGEYDEFLRFLQHQAALIPRPKSQDLYTALSVHRVRLIKYKDLWDRILRHTSQTDPSEMMLYEEGRRISSYMNDIINGFDEIAGVTRNRKTLDDLTKYFADHYHVSGIEGSNEDREYVFHAEGLVTFDMSRPPQTPNADSHRNRKKSNKKGLDFEEGTPMDVFVFSDSVFFAREGHLEAFHFNDLMTLWSWTLDSFRIRIFKARPPPAVLLVDRIVRCPSAFLWFDRLSSCFSRKGLFEEYGEKMYLLNHFEDIKHADAMVRICESGGSRRQTFQSREHLQARRLAEAEKKVDELKASLRQLQEEIERMNRQEEERSMSMRREEILIEVEEEGEGEGEDIVAGAMSGVVHSDDEEEEEFTSSSEDSEEEGEFGSDDEGMWSISSSDDES